MALFSGEICTKIDRVISPHECKISPQTILKFKSRQNPRDEIFLKAKLNSFKILLCKPFKKCNLKQMILFYLVSYGIRFCIKTRAGNKKQFLSDAGPQFTVNCIRPKHQV